MFIGLLSHRPGQELIEFKVLRPYRRETSNGREVCDSESTIGIIRAILAAAKPEEIERWRQLEHPITHKIIKRGSTEFDIRPGDVFEYSSASSATETRASSDIRRFYNQTMPYNIGDLGHWTIYYCLERMDVA